MDLNKPIASLGDLVRAAEFATANAVNLKRIADTVEIRKALDEPWRGRPSDLIQARLNFNKRFLELSALLNPDPEEET